MSVALSVTITGDGPPLVILHGLFGSARNWTAIARRLATDRQVLAVDLRNHGASPWAGGMGYRDLAGDVLDLLDRHGIARADILGHSMGGKTAMTLALDHGARVGGLIVADIAPVPYRHSHLGLIQAMQAIDLAAAGRRGAVDQALAVAVPDAGTRAFLMQNLVTTGPGERGGGERAGGGLAWRLNLEALAAGMDDLIGFPQMGGRVFDRPALFLAGERSDYIRPGHHDTLLGLFPRATIVTIPDAGHWLHAEQPEAVIAAVSGFLGRLQVHPSRVRP